MKLQDGISLLLGGKVKHGHQLLKGGYVTTTNLYHKEVRVDVGNFTNVTQLEEVHVTVITRTFGTC